MAALSSPQLLVVGETTQKAPETILNHTAKQSYASNLLAKQSATKIAKLELCPVTFDHGEPRVEFTVEEVNQFTIEEGLHQAVIVKFSYGKPELQEFRKIFAKQFDVKGYCSIGQLEFRHLLVRFDSFDDYVQFVSRSTGYIKSKGDKFFFRTFPWALGFNPREETSKSVVWISFPDLPPNFFAKKSLMSIASTVGKPLAVDKATQDRTRPSAARVKVLLDLLDKHPKKIKIHIVDKVSGKSVEFYQMVVYNNLPKYCTCCNHQGHAEETCCRKIDESKDGVVDAAEKLQCNGLAVLEKLQGDAREHLNSRQYGKLEIDDTTGDQQRIQSTGDQIATVENPMLKENTADDRANMEIIATAAQLCNGSNDRALSDHKVKTVGKVLLSQVAQDVNNRALSDPKVKTTGKKLLSQFAQGVINSKAGQWSVVHRPFEASNVEKESHSHVVGPLVDNKVTINNCEAFAQTNMERAQMGSFDGSGVQNIASVGRVFEMERVNGKHEESALPFSHKGQQQLKVKADNVQHMGLNEVQQIKEKEAAPVTRVIEIEKAASPVGRGTGKEKEQNIAGQLGRLTTQKAAKDANLIQNATNEAAENSHAATEKLAEKVELHEGSIGKAHAGHLVEQMAGHVDAKEAESNAPITGQVNEKIDQISGHAGQLCLKQQLLQIAGHAGHVNGNEHIAGQLKEAEIIEQNAGNKSHDGKNEESVQRNFGTDVHKDRQYGAARVVSLHNAATDGVHQNQIVEFSSPNHASSVAHMHIDRPTRAAYVDRATFPNAPSLYFSSPQVEKIIKDTQAGMMLTPMIKHPLVTLNTSVQEIPSQSVESFGEHSSASGQLLSTSNNQQQNIAMISISRASTNELCGSKDQQGMSSAIVSKSKSWTDRVEGQEENDPAVVQTSAIISAEERKLLDSMDKVVSQACDERGYESNEELSTLEEVGSCSNLNVTDYPNSRQLLVNSGQKPMRLSSTTDLLSHDRQLLDAMLNAHPFEILGRDPYSANHGNRSRNEVHIQ